MKNLEKFKKIIKDMDKEQLRDMYYGMQIFTKICIENKFKTQRNAIIDFAITAKFAYLENVLESMNKLPK